MNVNTMQLKLFQEFLQTVDKYQAFVVDVTDVARFPSDASADEQKFTLSKAIEVTESSATRSPPRRRRRTRSSSPSSST